MWNSLFSSVNLLEKGVNTSLLRNEVISNNIANVDTPGFKASDVRFEDIMAQSLGTDTGSLKLSVTNERHISGIGHVENAEEAVVVRDSSTSAGMDENNVNIEHEMVELAKNTIQYFTLVSKMNSEFRKLNSAIDVK